MPRKRPYTRMRRYKRTSNRKLSFRDLVVLEFLWKWKVASFHLLREAAYKNKSIWWAYKAIRQLQKDKLIEVLPRGKYVDQELYTLTESGFEIVLMDRDDINEYRYRVHAPAHDYLATCLQLGDLWQSGVELSFYTEQMISSIAESNFPKKFKIEKIKHIPDGVTCLQSRTQSVLIGYEVDLNLKGVERYYETARYYAWGIEPAVIFWLVKNEWMAHRIFSITEETFKSDPYDKKYEKCVQFILLDDFKNHGWGAKIVLGSQRGETVKNVHAKVLQSLGKDTAKFGSICNFDLFFRKHKSPQKTKTYDKTENPPTP